MTTRSFGKVTIERRGAEGTVTVSGRNWFAHPSWFWLAFVGLCLMAAASAFRLGEPAAMSVAVFPVGMLLLLSLVTIMEELIRKGIVTRAAKLEVYTKDATVGGYREASSPARLQLRTPRGEVSLDRVRNVTRTSRYVQPKDGSSYWVYRVFVALHDEAFEIASFPRDEAAADGCARAIASLLGDVPVRQVPNDPTKGGVGVVVAAVTGAVFMVALFTVAGGQESFVARFGARWVGLAAMALALLLLRFGILPFVASVIRRTQAEKLARAFAISAAPGRTSTGETVVFAVSALAFLVAGGLVFVRGAALAEADRAEAADEKQQIRGWAWGHDALPIPAELNGDGVEDYLGAFASREKNGATVVAAFDGQRHETIWRSRPFMMNVGHNHYTLAGDRVVVVEVKTPPRLLDAATGADRGSFPDDPVWSKINVSRICPDRDVPGRVVVQGHLAGEVTLALDLAGERFERIDAVPWCHGRHPPAAARTITRPPVANAIEVADYRLVLGPTAQVLRGGKLIKQFPFADVQDGAMCGAPDAPKAWVPVAAGGGVLVDLEKAEVSPAERPPWCPEHPLGPEGAPSLPHEGPDGITIDSRGLLSDDRLVALGSSQAPEGWLLGYDRLGRVLAWKTPIPKPIEGGFDWDAAHGLVAIAFKSGGDLEVFGFSADRGVQRFATTLPNSRSSIVHGVRVGEQYLYVAHQKRLEILDATTGAVVAHHGD